MQEFRALQTGLMIVSVIDQARQHDPDKPVDDAKLTQALAFLTLDCMLSGGQDSFENLLQTAVHNFGRLSQRVKMTLTNLADNDVLYVLALSHGSPNCTGVLDGLLSNFPAWKPTILHFKTAASSDSSGPFIRLEYHNIGLDIHKTRWTEIVLIEAVQNKTPAGLDILRAILMARENDDDLEVDRARSCAKWNDVHGENMVTELDDWKHRRSSDLQNFWSGEAESSSADETDEDGYGNSEIGTDLED
jgi:hypothetical protein